MNTNEMIYRTLRTKMDKEPRYRDVLADLGIEVFDSSCSTQGFWSVRYIPTGNMLVISKGYDNRVHLYGGENGYQEPNAKDLKRFDYIGFLKRHKKRQVLTDTEYETLRNSICQCKRDIKWAEEDLSDIDKKIAHLMEQRDHYKERLKKATDGLQAARERVAELRKGN